QYVAHHLHLHSFPTRRSSDLDSQTGLTTVSGGLLQLFSSGNLSSGDALIVSGTGSFDINGRNQTLGLVTNSSSNSNAITNSSGTSATLTIGDGSTGGGAYTGKMNVTWNQAATNSTISGNFTNTGNL